MTKKRTFNPPPTRRVVYIDATPEVLLDVLKKKSNVPKDATIVLATVPPIADTRGFWTQGKLIRLFIESNEFVPVREGEEVPRFEVFAAEND